MLAGRHPWPIHEDPASGAQKLSFEGCPLSKEVINLISGMLQVEPASRLSSQEVLTHAWIGKDGSMEDIEGSANHVSRVSLTRAPSNVSSSSW